MIATYLMCLIASVLMHSPTEAKLIYKFSSDAPSSDWTVVDDVVMGGQSEGAFQINDNGHGVFSGKVSLANNGGFSSIRHNPESILTEHYQIVAIRLKGDGSTYQLRLKSDAEDMASYVHSFETNGEWEIIELPLKGFYPSFRGTRLNRPNFSADQIEEIAILIGNKVSQNFELEMDYIQLQ